MRHAALFVLLFSVIAMAEQPFVRLESLDKMQFACIIPDHGGSCNEEEAAVSYSAPVKAWFRLTNFALSETSPYRTLLVASVPAGEKARVRVQFLTDRKSKYGSLVMTEGKNRIRVELLSDSNNSVMASVEKDIDVTVEWEY